MVNQTNDAASSYDAGVFRGGRAFSIDDVLMAVRWSGLVQRNGYNLTVSPFDRHADEVIEIRLRSHKTAVYRIHRGANAIIATDCIGVSASFPTLADALQMVVSLSGKERRFMVKGSKPPCIRLIAVLRATGFLPSGREPDVTST